MKAFDFSGTAQKVREEMARFSAAAVKPAGFDAECDKRLSAYLFKHKSLVVAGLQKQFPNTYGEIVPYVLPLTRMFVNERAKVFSGDLDFPLVGEDGKPIEADQTADPVEPADGAEPKQTPGKDLARAWAEMLDESDLSLKLEREDRYATLLGSSFLKLSHWDDGVRAHIAFPSVVDVVWDPDHQGQLDMAFGVRVELASEPAPVIADAKGEQRPPRKRWEFWCARPGEEQHVIVDSEEGVDPEANDVGLAAFPYTDDAGRAVIPLVLFTQNTGELPAFTQAEEGLVDLDIAFAVELSNIQHVALAQGYGQLVVSTTEVAAEKPPASYPVGPSRAIVPPAGWTASMLASGAPIADLIAKAEKVLRLAALMHGIPPGAVSLEARAASSGVALQIEMRPLLEARNEAIKAYRGAMRRCAKVAKAVWNAFAEGSEKPTIPAGVLPRWAPGDVQMPTDPHQALDDLVMRMDRKLLSYAEAIAQDRGIPLEEAEKIAAKILAAPAPTKLPAAPGAPTSAAEMIAAARERMKTPAEQRMQEPPPAG